VYNEDDIPVDLEQRVFYALVEDNFQLTFNDTVVADLAQIQFSKFYLLSTPVADIFILFVLKRMLFSIAKCCYLN